MSASDSTPSSSTPGEEPTAGGEDDNRRRFREALERKQGRHAAAAGAGEGGQAGAAHPHSGPAKAQRTFRRKSG